MKRLFACALLASLTACATHPDNIKAVSNAQPCTPADRQRLAELSKVQAATATNDAMGVFLIGLPVGSIAGEDHKDEIARLKGSCGAPPKTS